MMLAGVLNQNTVGRIRIGKRQPYNETVVIYLLLFFLQRDKAEKWTQMLLRKLLVKQQWCIPFRQECGRIHKIRRNQAEDSRLKPGCLQDLDAG